MLITGEGNSLNNKKCDRKGRGGGEVRMGL